MTQPTVFSPARVAQGPTLYVSGQTPGLPDGSVPDGAEAQTRVVLDKITAILKEHGLDWASVIMLRYYLCDLADAPAMRTAVLEVLPEPKPASTLLVVKGLVDNRFLVEIDAVAELSA